jgi:peptide/nickel transport system permease protein
MMPGDPAVAMMAKFRGRVTSPQALQTGYYLQAIVPGAAIALLGAAFALLNYAFDEISNPALRPVRRAKAIGGGLASLPAALIDQAAERRAAKAAAKSPEDTRG